MILDKRRALIGGLTAVVIIVAGGGLLWWSFSDWLRCTSDRKRAPDEMITACTAVIESRLAPARLRAYALAHRGNAYRALGDNARAMADYDHAVNARPGLSYPLISRGMASYDEHQYDRAIRDFDLAILIDPRSAWGVQQSRLRLLSQARL